MKTRTLLALAAMVASLGAVAADVPKPGRSDARVRTVRYDPNNVVVVEVRRGIATRVVLGPDEKITKAAVTGMSARCDDANDEWCIAADPGDNQIFVRPRDNAVRTNMELRTDKRDYSFEFVVQLDARGRPEATRDAMFRVVFEYDLPPPPNPRSQAAARSLMDFDAQAMRTAAASTPALAASPAERLRLEPIEPTNANYTMQVLEKGADAAPSLVFDDGRFTYFEFLGAREIPAIFAYGSDNEPTRVNWHMRPPFIVVQRTARKFTLRLGQAVVGVFNESFDAVGVDTPTATISSDVKRHISEEPKR